MNVDEEYQKIINLLDAGDLELGRELLNVRFSFTNENGTFSEPLYSSLTDDQFISVLSKIGSRITLDGSPTALWSMNDRFEVVTTTNISTTILLTSHVLDGMMMYTLTNTDKNRRQRMFILDLCLT